MEPIHRLVRSFSTIVSAVLAAALSGCAVLPTGATGRLADAQQTRLVGGSTQEIRTLLGGPLLTLNHEDTTYLLYGAFGEEGYFILAHPVLYLFALGGGALPYGSDNVFHCLLLEFHDDKVVRTELEAVRKFEAGARRKNCLRAFANDDAFMAVAAAWLTARARKTRTSSAKELATRVLGLLELGETVAAIELAQDFQ